MQALTGDSGARLLVAPDEWLRVIEEEYLDIYVRSGGSAVKFASGAEDELVYVARRIEEMAGDGGYYVAKLNPLARDPAEREKDLHRIDRFFFAVTEGVYWRGWAAAQAMQYLLDAGIGVAANRQLSDLEPVRDFGCRRRCETS
jgi:hypothetical protein